jgi:hypothetical protein
MGLEVVISESLLSALQEKSDNFADKLAILGDTISQDITKLAVQEAPHRTGNLQGSIRPEQDGPFSYIISPDEGVAPYALYVILGHMTRPVTVDGGSQGKMSYHGFQHFVQGNDFLQRAEDQSQSIIDSDVNELEDWCNNLDS